MLREKLHMSHYEIMWQRSWINIEMMLADQARLVKNEETETVDGKYLAQRRKERKQNG